MSKVNMTHAVCIFECSCTVDSPNVDAIENYILWYTQKTGGVSLAKMVLVSVMWPPSILSSRASDTWAAQTPIGCDPWSILTFLQSAMCGTYTVHVCICIAELISIKPICVAVLPSNRDSQTRTLISISQYKVRWTGYLLEDDTSEPRSNIHPDIFKEFAIENNLYDHNWSFGCHIRDLFEYLADPTEE